MSKWEKVKWAEVVEIKNGKNQKAVADVNGRYPIYGSGGVMGYANDYLCDEDTVVIGRKGSINKPIYVAEKFWNVDTAFGLNAKKDRLHPKYLFYFCVNFDFEKLNTTVTIPSLTKSNLHNIEMPLPQYEIQKKIAKTLDTAAELLAMRKQQLADLDNLIKSTFYDMFGDLTSNEKQWESASIVDVCTEIVDCVNKTAPIIEGVSPYKMLRTTNIKKGKVDTRNVNYVDEQTFQKWTRRSVPKRGDVLLTREAPIGETGIIESDDFLFLGQRIVSYRANDSIIHPIYLMYLMQSDYFQDQIRRLARGSTVKHLSVPECNLFVAYVPPIELQNKFANMVTKIEEQKALVKKAIDETQHLFGSLMSEYFE
ncbi:restriction endonuclease subunit S [Paenibacillus chitinolyticus]|uniref:restriction endonuclease subunit S n=1 Tax=Paenibacillus chitinolyticus TaxID=79263 RepID=UPI001C43FBAA|nr:restriction endonuclease subunit S [Paenibacillus chitinolyticus]